MPRVSIRLRTIYFLKKSYRLEKTFNKTYIQLSNAPHFDYGGLADLFEIYSSDKITESILKDILHRRYLSNKLYHLPKVSTQAEKLLFLDKIDDEGSLEELRMNRESFEKLIELIEDNHIYNSSDHPQVNIRLQVAFVLEKLGCDGNGVSLNRFARKYGTGSGCKI